MPVYIKKEARDKSNMNVPFNMVEMDWCEVGRLAEQPEYQILPVLKKMVFEVANELGKSSPYHS
ncbi:MAG: hypothetical protein M1608_14085 [Candidatus Omnitrophica bacterium]|nr:hypothetical protein [Candidatus Omnitrophota bacterium]